MAVQLPTSAQVESVAAELGLSLSKEDVASFQGLMKGYVDAYNIVDRLPDPLPLVKYPRTPGHRPAPAENPMGAWYVKSTISGASDGRLKG